MSTSREQAQFRKSKTPVILKYQEEHARLFDEIAARGFLDLPGYAYDAENRLELITKMNLSDLNYKILSETIDREMKQSGIDYDLLYKTALMTWELKKQSLLVSWEAELAGIKQGMAADENTLELLSIEVSQRAVVLMEAKTAIELSMEGYRKTLADLEGDVSPYEVNLANAKLLTAQKKLELLPIIEIILTKEQELLALERSKAAEYTSLMAAEQVVFAKKGTLTPYVNALASKSEEYASKILNDQIQKEEQIADEKIAQAQAAVTKSGYQVQELTADIETETKRLELLASRRVFEDVQFAYEQGLITHETALTMQYQNSLRADFNQLLAAERATVTSIIDSKTQAETTRNATRLQSEIDIAAGAKTADADSTAASAYQAQTVADVQAAGRLTAELTHLIG